MVMSPLLTLDPKTTFVKRYPMLAVFPLHVPVSRFLEREGLEPCCYRQLAQPTINRNIDSIRCRISDDEAYDRIAGRSSPKGYPHLSHVLEVRCDHCVVILLAAV